MNPTESIRLNKSEIDTIVVGCQYNPTIYTLDYNKSKVMSQSLGTKPAQAFAKATNPNAEQGEDDGNANASEISRQKLTEALKEIHSKCQNDLEVFPKKLAIGVGIQSRLLSTQKSPTGTANFNFTTEECEFITESLRTFESAEIMPVQSAEIILGSFFINGNYNGEAYTESARQTKEDRLAVQARRDEFICLQAKILTYGKSQVTGNDQ